MAVISSLRGGELRVERCMEFTVFLDDIRPAIPPTYIFWVTVWYLLYLSAFRRI